MKNQNGVSLLEAMVATAVIAIGFMAVYTLAITSTRVLMGTVDREKGNMIANAVFEDLITDTPNLLSYHNMDFKTSGQGSATHLSKKPSGRRSPPSASAVLKQTINGRFKW